MAGIARSIGSSCTLFWEYTQPIKGTRNVHLGRLTGYYGNGIGILWKWDKDIMEMGQATWGLVGDWKRMRTDGPSV